MVQSITEFWLTSCRDIVSHQWHSQVFWIQGWVFTMTAPYRNYELQKENTIIYWISLYLALKFKIRKWRFSFQMLICCHLDSTEDLPASFAPTPQPSSCYSPGNLCPWYFSISVGFCMLHIDFLLFIVYIWYLFYPFQSLEANKMSVLAAKMSKIEEALKKKDEQTNIFISQTREALEQKMEAHTEKRESHISDLKAKLKDHVCISLSMFLSYGK